MAGFNSSWENATILDGGVWDSEQGTTGALSVASDQFFVGAQSLKYNRASSSLFDAVRKAFTGVDTFAVRFAIRIGTDTPAQEIDCIAITDSSANELIDIEIVNGQFKGYANGYFGSNYTYALNTWYQIEVKCVKGVSNSWKVWDAAGTTLLLAEQTDTVNVTASQITRLDLGSTFLSGVASFTYWIDGLATSDTGYVGPLTASGPTNQLAWIHA